MFCSLSRGMSPSSTSDSICRLDIKTGAMGQHLPFLIRSLKCCGISLRVSFTIHVISYM